MNVILMERLDFQLFFDVIKVVIDALLHVLWYFSYTLVTEFSNHVAQVALLLVTSGICSYNSRTVTCRFSSISCSTFAIVLAETEGRPECCLSWKTIHPYMNCLTHFRTFLMSIHCGPYTLHNWWWMSMRVVPLALKKQSLHATRTWQEKRRGAPLQTAAQSRLSVTASSALRGFEGGNQATCQCCGILHKALLTAPAPWSLYFMDMPRIVGIARIFFGCRWFW